MPPAQSREELAVALPWGRGVQGDVCPPLPEALRGDGLPDVRLTQEGRAEKQAGGPPCRGPWTSPLAVLVDHQGPQRRGTSPKFWPTHSLNRAGCHRAHSRCAEGLGHCVSRVPVQVVESPSFRGSRNGLPFVLTCRASSGFCEAESLLQLPQIRVQNLGRSFSRSPPMKALEQPQNPRFLLALSRRQTPSAELPAAPKSLLRSI